MQQENMVYYQYQDKTMPLRRYSLSVTVSDQEPMKKRYSLMENSLPSLVTIEYTIPLADSRHIAQELGIRHGDFFSNLIVKYQQEIEEDFGLIRFENGKTTTDKQGRGRPTKYALLTEDQTYAFLAYSQNTEQARTCKRKLVKAFAIAREAAITLQVAPNADLANLTARQIRMVGLMARITDLIEANQPCDHLIHLFIAECQSAMLADRIWEGPSVKRIKKPGVPVF